MADDITLTVRVRDMTHGEFQRLDRELQRMRANLQGVNRATQSGGMHAKRMGNDVQTLESKLLKMRNTGTLTRRELAQVKTTLEGMSHSALQAARSGEITQARFTDLTHTINRMRGEFHRLGADVDGASNTLRRVGNAAGSAGSSGLSFTSVFGNMRAKLIGTAVVLGASLLPTIGALAPMLAGLGAMAGVAALAFSGLNKPTKQLSESQKAFKKGLKPLIDDFHNLRKAAQDAVLPKLTKSFGDIHKAIKALNPVIKVAGAAFGTLVDKVAKGVSSKDFMGPFLKNVRMGTTWVLQFAGSFGKFTQAFFEFGAKSGPALTAWQDLLGGFLSRGLPGLFTNMESGIKGSSSYLRGLSSLINDGLLPGIGRLLGKFMEAFGPAIGDMLREVGHLFYDLSGTIGQVFTALSPVGSAIGHVVSSMLDLTRISIGTFGDMFAELGGALFKSFVEGFSGDQVSSVKDGLKSLATWVQDNEGAIRNAFAQIAGSFIDVVNAVIQGVPQILTMLKLLTDMALTSFGVFIDGAAFAFDWIPGVGTDIDNAKTSFDNFSTSVKNSLNDSIAASQKFADQATPNLTRAKLSLNVDTAKRNIEDIKSRLKDPQLTAERRAKLTVDKKDAEQQLARAKGELAAFDRKQAEAKLSANASQFFNTVSKAIRTRIPTKTGKVVANTSSFWSGISGIIGRVVGTSYINVKYQKVDSSFQNKGFARGGAVRRLADGGTADSSGPVSGSGTSTSDSIPAMLSNGEYVIRASSVQKYGQGFLDAVNNGNIVVPKLANGGMARGGLTKKQKAAAAKRKAAAAAEHQARNDAVGELTISHFGKIAGYKNDEFRHELGMSDTLGNLVDSLNKWRSTILKATHGGLEQGLLKQLDKAGKSLIKYQEKLGKVNASLDKAKTHLDDLKQAAASLRDSVTSGVMTATDITGVAQNDKNVTVSDIMAKMSQSRDKSSAFAGALQALKAKGVDKEIINQIAGAGIEGGGIETAGALLSASASEISSINEMQKQITANAKAAGNTAADAMYSAGIKAAQGLVNGLTKQKKNIENAMMNIAKAMEKAIKHALGIKSPSKVMEQVGHHTAEGFVIGMQKNRKVDSAWESMLTTHSGTGRASYGPSTGGQPIQIYIGGKFLDEIILDSNRRTVRTRGGNVQAVYGRRTS